MVDVFEKRLRRAETLEKEWPFAGELLRFLQAVLTHQREMHRSFVESPTRNPEGYDLFLLQPWLAPTLDLLEAAGPRDLARRIPPLRPWRYADWLDYLTMVRAGTDASVQEGDPMDDPACWCVARIALQPYLMSISGGTAEQPSNRCPLCGARPLVSVLREDKAAETVRRTLICSLCSHEWEFARVLCPSCNEEKSEKLPRYTAQEIPWMRVDACDSCHTYLKSVDLTLNWDADPIVDELASTPLDVIARDHGYTKITPNLAGI